MSFWACTFFFLVFMGGEANIDLCCFLETMNCCILPTNNNQRCCYIPGEGNCCV